MMEYASSRFALKVTPTSSRHAVASFAQQCARRRTVEGCRAAGRAFFGAAIAPPPAASQPVSLDPTYCDRPDMGEAERAVQITRWSAKRSRAHRARASIALACRLRQKIG
jgi:hypothetical protein